MPMIYIHGVRHRKPEKLLGMEKHLAELVGGLRRDVPRLPARFPVRAPYWGDRGVKTRFEKLLPIDALDRPGERQHERYEEPLGAAALDLLSEAADDDAAEMRALLLDQLGQMPLTPKEYEELRQLLERDWQAAYRAAQAAGNAGEQAANAREDRERVQESRPEADNEMVWKRSISQRLLDLVDRTASKLVVNREWTRNSMRRMQNNVSMFLGDAMTYVIQRESLGEQSPILEHLLKHIPEQRNPEDPLIVMTHSMGAAIFYDILTQFRQNLKVDCWISVGSQIGQFANLGLLAVQSQAALSKQRLPGLEDRVGCWVNFYDPCDFLNYLTEPAFTHVRDWQYENARGPAFSHSWYFKEQRFWDSARELLKEALSKALP